MTYQPKSYRKFLATSVAAAMVATVAAPLAPATVEAADAKVFPDVVAGAWYEKNVNYLVERGIIEGNPDGTFGPQNGVTRAQAAVMITRALDLELPETPALGFPDTNNEAWYAASVAALVDLGIVEGNPDGTFAPNATITRAALAKMIVEAFELEANDKFEADFSDTVAGAWYEDYVVALASLGIVGGYTDGTFKPNATVNRAEAAAFFHRTEVAEERLEVELGELVVETVEASTTLVNSTADYDQYLELTVNGGVEVTVDELVELGYTVKFVATKEAFANTSNRTESENGLLRRTNLPATFEYQVSVSKDDEVITSNLTTVKSEDFSTIVDAAKETDLRLGNGVKVNSGTLTTKDTGINFAKVTFVTRSGDEMTVNYGDYAAEKVSFKSSNTNVLIVNATGAVTVLGTGNATVTIEKGNLKQEVQLTVVSEERKASTVTSSLAEVKLVNKAGNEVPVRITVLDQYGDAFPNLLTVEDALNSEERYITNIVEPLTSGDVRADQLSKGEYVYTVKPRTGTKGQGNIVFKRGATTLFSLPVHISDDAKVVEYRLEAKNADSLTLDPNPFNEDMNASVTMVLNGYNKDGFLAGKESLSGFNIASSDKDVASVPANIYGNEFSVTAKKSGSVNITVKEGSVTRASATVNVQDTTPQISDLKFESALTITTGTLSLNDILKVSNIDLTGIRGDATVAYELDEENNTVVFKVGEVVLGELKAFANVTERSSSTATPETLEMIGFGEIGSTGIVGLVRDTDDNTVFATLDSGSIVLRFTSERNSKVFTSTVSVNVPATLSTVVKEQQVEKLFGNKVRAREVATGVVNTTVRSGEGSTKLVDVLTVDSVIASGLIVNNFNINGEVVSPASTDLTQLTAAQLVTFVAEVGREIETATGKDIADVTLNDLQGVAFSVNSDGDVTRFKFNNVAGLLSSEIQSVDGSAANYFTFDAVVTSDAVTLSEVQIASVVPHISVTVADEAATNEQRDAVLTALNLSVSERTVATNTVKVSHNNVDAAAGRISKSSFEAGTSEVVVSFDGITFLTFNVVK